MPHIFVASPVNAIFRGQQVQPIIPTEHCEFCQFAKVEMDWFASLFLANHNFFEHCTFYVGRKSSRTMRESSHCWHLFPFLSTGVLIFTKNQFPSEIYLNFFGGSTKVPRIITQQLQGLDFAHFILYYYGQPLSVYMLFYLQRCQMSGPA